jgi:hypothetical protein
MLDENEIEEKKNEQIELHQSFLNQQNAIYMLFKRFSDCNDESKHNDDIFIHLIEFGINMLDV